MNYKKLISLSLVLFGVMSCFNACSGDTSSTETENSTLESAISDEKTSAASSDDATDSNTSSDDASADDQTPVPAEGVVVTKDTGIDGLDFIVEVPEGRDIKILQLTDMQIIDLDGVRATPGNSRYNQVYGAFFSNETSKNEYVRCWRYVEEAIQKSCPDLIVLTGDNIYGQTDDSGEVWERVVKTMDSYKIPWAVIWGNHDNESDKGVRWQIKQVENSEYGIIKQGSVTGNSNYTIGLKQGGKIKRICYMLDTGGCNVYSNPGEGMNATNVDIDIIHQGDGLEADQVNWMKTSYESISASLGEKLPSSYFLHIPPSEAGDPFEKKYNVKSYPFTPNGIGDFGVAAEGVYGFKTEGFWETAKATGCDTMYLGHLHTMSTSISYNGIRVTFGLKVGTYDYHRSDMLGSTLTTLKEGKKTITVEHLYSELVYVNPKG